MARRDYIDSNRLNSFSLKKKKPSKQLFVSYGRKSYKIRSSFETDAHVTSLWLCLLTDGDLLMHMEWKPPSVSWQPTVYG